MGSHAMHDGFAVIQWGAAGIGPGTAGLLWSLSVAAEVIVFLFAGRPLLDRLGPAGAAMLAAAAGIVRWAVIAETAWLPVLAAIEPLHGLTFALLHLTCMRLLAGCVPRHLAATALTPNVKTRILPENGSSGANICAPPRRGRHRRGPQGLAVPNQPRTQRHRVCAVAAGVHAPIGNHTFRATCITAYLANGGALEHAQEMAAHESPRTTKLYDRTKERLTQDEVERIRL